MDETVNWSTLCVFWHRNPQNTVSDGSADFQQFINNLLLKTTQPSITASFTLSFVVQLLKHDPSVVEKE
jgi:hypothetical protein